MVVVVVMSWNRRASDLMIEGHRKNGRLKRT